MSVSSTPSLADVSLRWNADALGDEAASSNKIITPILADYLAQSNVISDFVSMLDDAFVLDELELVEIGAESGPVYDLESKAIRMPFGYLERAIRTQAQLVDEDQEVVAIDRALDVVEYTLYHLLGHALAGDESVDADSTAEALSTWIMLSYWPNGAEQWFQDTLAFSDASIKLDGPLDDYWHEHSLYKIRRDTLRCWILGKDPVNVIDLMPAVLDPEERKARCIQSWQKLDRQARELLGDRLAPDSSLRLPAQGTD